MKLKSKLNLIAIIITSILMIAPLTAGQVQAYQNSGGHLQEPDFSAMDTYLEEQFNHLGIPGASLAIVEGDRIVHTQGFGITGPGGSKPTPQTPYFIGSLTKSFTALAVMQLVEAGKIDLDAPVQRYLSWFTLADPSAAAQITIRHLLNQTSGFPQTGGLALLADFDDSPEALEKQMRGLSTIHLARPVGTEFEYSNLNFNLLGLVVEEVSGENYSEYVQKHIFSPLDMNHSYTAKPAAQKDNLAVGYQMWFGFPVPVPNMPVPVGSLPSGQLIASAEDMGRYLIAQLNSGSFEGNQIVSARGIDEMHHPAAKVSMMGEDRGNYGMGWFVQNIPNDTLVFHDGEVPDYFAYMVLLPEHNRAMVLLVNANEQIYNYALWSISEATALWLAGNPIGPDSRAIIPWAVAASLLIPVLQILGIILTRKKAQQWQAKPTSRPGRVVIWLVYILLPLTINLTLFASAIAILASGLFSFIMLFMGDIISVIILSGLIAIFWFTQIPLIFRAMRKS